LLSISGKSSVISPKRDFIEEITGKTPLKGERWLDRIRQTGSFLHFVGALFLDVKN